MFFCSVLRAEDNRYTWIVTNNPKVKDCYESQHRIIFVKGGYRDVLVTVRDFIHKGYLLETHPLMGSLKPNETPYRSVLVSDEASASTDSASVMIIEDGILVFDRFAKNPREDRGDGSSERIREDFKEIDFSLIKSALD